MSSYDLVLKGGRIVASDGTTGAEQDVAIADGRVVAIEAGVDSSGAEVIDCTGGLVLPGLIEMHSHIYSTAPAGSINPDAAHLLRGVLSVNDAGSAGAADIEGFLQHAVGESKINVTCFLNISSVGLSKIPESEFSNPDDVDVPFAIRVAKEHPDVVRGIKVRLSKTEAGDLPLEYLAMAQEAAAAAGIPVMAHVGASTCTLDEILRAMRPGDIVTHSFHGKGERIVQNDKVLDSAWDARERGVLFDVGHGTTQMSYEVARQAISQGFFPHLVSSDLSHRNWKGPAFDSITVISKLIALGMPQDKAFEAATTTAAKVLGLDAKGYGQLVVDGPAIITVLGQPEAAVVPDAAGDELHIQRFEPIVAVNHGTAVTPSPWRGYAGKD